MANHLCGAGESMAASWYSRIPGTTTALPLVSHSTSIQPLHRSIQSFQRRFVQLDDGCTNDGDHLGDDQSGGGTGGAGFLQGCSAGQWLLERDDDPLPVHGLHLEQGARTRDLLLLSARRSRPDRPPLPLHGPGWHCDVLWHLHQPNEGDGAPWSLQGQSTTNQPVRRHVVSSSNANDYQFLFAPLNS